MCAGAREGARPGVSVAAVAAAGTLGQAAGSPTVILGDGGCCPCRGSMPDRECLPDARELGGGAFLSWGWPGSLRKGALSPEECRTLKPLRTEEGLGRASLVGRR